MLGICVLFQRVWFSMVPRIGLSPGLFEVEVFHDDDISHMEVFLHFVIL